MISSMINVSSSFQRSTRCEWHVALPQWQESSYTISQAAAGATEIPEAASIVFMRCTKDDRSEWNALKVTSDTRLKKFTGSIFDPCGNSGQKNVKVIVGDLSVVYYSVLRLPHRYTTQRRETAASA
jgi:hypothetical protein